MLKLMAIRGTALLFALSFAMTGCRFGGVCVNKAQCDKYPDVNPTGSAGGGDCAASKLVGLWESSAGATLRFTETCTMSGSNCNFSGTIQNVKESASPHTMLLTVTNVGGSASGSNCPSLGEYNCSYNITQPNLLDELVLSCPAFTTGGNNIAGTFTEQ